MTVLLLLVVVVDCFTSEKVSFLTLLDWKVLSVLLVVTEDDDCFSSERVSDVLVVEVLCFI